MNAPTAALMGSITTIPPLDVAPEQGIEQQRQFMRLLGLLNPKVGSFTVQTFADCEFLRKDFSLIHVIQSPTHDKLLQLQARGAGIYVTVNETDGKGRKSENITRVRAVFQEDDNGFDGAFPLQPSFVVETSPEHFHRYWLVEDDWPADEQGCADFKAVMERMVESYGSDKNAKDIARVLRFPGFLNRKSGTPHLVHIVEASGRRYTRADIIAAFPPVKRAEKTHTEHTWTPQGNDDQRIRDALRSINADDRDIWLQCGMAIKDHFGDSGRQLWDEWSRQSDKYNERDQDRTWKSFKRNGISIGTLFYHAQQAGWRDERIHHRPSNGADVADWKHGGNDKVAAEAAAPEHDPGATWPTLDKAAYHGIVGEIVETISPHTEADPAALLTQLLTLAGKRHRPIALLSGRIRPPPGQSIRLADRRQLQGTQGDLSRTYQIDREGRRRNMGGR
jgi:Primase C terminal 2 (PriCT-2)/RepB DNA-primase from phage plasmid